jgi:hypothetical protein
MQIAGGARRFNKRAKYFKMKLKESGGKGEILKKG